MGASGDNGDTSRDRLKAAGAVLIVIGVGMWGVYAIGKYGLGWNITDRDFLPYHLMTIIPGMLLWHSRSLIEGLRRLLQRRKERGKERSPR